MGSKFSLILHVASGAIFQVNKSQLGSYLPTTEYVFCSFQRIAVLPEKLRVPNSIDKQAATIFTIFEWFFSEILQKTGFCTGANVASWRLFTSVMTRVLANHMLVYRPHDHVAILIYSLFWHLHSGVLLISTTLTYKSNV